MITTILIMFLLLIGSCFAILLLLGCEISELIEDLEELEIELSNLEQENMQLKAKLEPDIIDGEIK